MVHYTKQLLSALIYGHSRGLAHGYELSYNHECNLTSALNSENLVFEALSSEARLKLINYGNNLNRLYTDQHKKKPHYV